MAHYDVYREQLAGLYHGHALWEPAPAGLYDQVRVGDVGIVRQGHFLRMFNALFPADNPLQSYGVPYDFTPLNMGPFGNIRTLIQHHGDYCSNTVSAVRDHEIEDQIQAAGPLADGGASASFRCRRNKGAFLSLPFNATRQDAIRTKVFETYIRRHCDGWLEFADRLGFDAKLEDILFVTGCDLTTSWAMATFVNHPLDAEITLTVESSGTQAPSARFQWSATNQPHNNELTQNTATTQCVFLRGFRAKRIILNYKRMKAFAEHLPDDPDNEPEASIELIREPNVPKHRDPLLGVLDYIAEKRPDDDLAIAHEDDLRVVEGVDVLTADAVENFLRQNEILVQSEKGVALLGDEDEEVVPEEVKMTFHAQAELGDEPVPLIVHPVLMKYLLEFDIATQAEDHDFDLPPEEFSASAVHPPVHVLILENNQGYPHNIHVLVSDKESTLGITVEDVLKTISTELRKSSSQREWAALNDDTRREVEEAFEDRARTEEERSGGLRRIDYLRGRNRLQVFPKHPLPEDEEVPQPLPSARALDLNVPGPSTAPVRATDKGKGRAV